MKMKELIDELKRLKLAIFDLDGVIYRGAELIQNADIVIQELQNKSIKVVFNSNNSTITRQKYVEKLNSLNIQTELSNIYTSATITSVEITKIKRNANIFVIGEIGLRQELEALGHRIFVEPDNYDQIDFVIVGLDRNFNYHTLEIAQKCILEGKAKFYATNADSTLPDVNGLKPGAGAIIKALEECTGQKPVKIFGKPEPFGIQLILNDFKIKPKNACIFGDRLNTDILAGNRAEIISIAVLTGITSKEDITKLQKEAEESKSIDENLIPNIVINSLEEIFKN